VRRIRGKPGSRRIGSTPIKVPRRAPDEAEIARLMRLLGGVEKEPEVEHPRSPARMVAAGQAKAPVEQM
jgi:hypothetical protein